MIAHRAVLSARSPTFKAMFASAFQESGRDATVHVQIGSQAGHALVDFLYSGAMRRAMTLASWREAIELYECAEYYQLPELAVRMVTVVARHISLDNVFDTFAIAQRHAKPTAQPTTSYQSIFERTPRPNKTEESPKPPQCKPLENAQESAIAEQPVWNRSMLGKQRREPTNGGLNRHDAAPSGLDGKEVKSRVDGKEVEIGVKGNGKPSFPAPISGSGELLMHLVQKYFARHFDAILERLLKRTVDSNAHAAGGGAQHHQSIIDMMLVLGKLKALQPPPPPSTTLTTGPAMPTFPRATGQPMVPRVSARAAMPKWPMPPLPGKSSSSSSATGCFRCCR
jgi:hypothetical protein